jgi:diacylglycerol O-acyltransferase / wax synthase
MALPAPGGMAELCKLASHIWSIPLDRSRPLWDMTLVENLDSVPGVHRGSFALITKIHHAAIDGVSGAEILGILFETSDRPAKSAEPAKWTGERVPGDLELLARSLGNLAREPVKLAKLLPTALKGAVGAAALNQVKKVELPRDSLLAPKTRFNSTISPHRSWAYAEFDMLRIRAVKAAFDVSINDAVLAICSGAMRRYLEARGELPATSLSAMLPISVRDDEQKGTQGNRVSAMLATLATDEADPAARLRAINKSTRG